MAKAKTGSKGFKTEELIRRYFLQAGFFVQRGLPLAYENSELTDIDIWVYERSATLSRRRLIVDVKDKVRPHAAERLFFVLGLSHLIGVESAGVATTDKNPALRTLAQKHKVIWINGDDINRLKSSQPLAKMMRLSEEDFLGLVQEVDKSRGGKHCATSYLASKSALADRFGVASANYCLDQTCRFAEQVIKSHPKSTSAKTLGRLTYSVAALSAASFDFASADMALRPAKERLTAMQNAIKYGADKKSLDERLNWTEAAIRDFAPEGNMIAKQVRSRLTKSMNNIPAEDLAEIIVNMSHDRRLFDAARSLEQAAFAPSPPTLDQLPIEAQGYLGAILDFAGIERRLFRESWHSTPIEQSGLTEEENEVTPETDVQEKLI